MKAPIRRSDVLDVNVWFLVVRTWRYDMLQILLSCLLLMFFLFKN